VILRLEKKGKYKLLIVIIGLLAASISYLKVFSLIRVSADSPSYHIAATRAAVKNKL